jgi:hypothetical protein
VSERLIIENDQVRLSANGEVTQCAATVDDWIGRVHYHSVHGMTDEPLPDNVKWLVTCGSSQICIVELKPEIRRIMWLDEKNSPVPFGPEALVRERRLATPYVILKVPFGRGKVLGRVEVFYRNEPLRSMDGPGGALYWANLLNVSPHAYNCTAWFCTQYLSAEMPRAGLQAGLHAVTNHLWGGSFNRSSEAHEGASTFSKAVQEKVDPRVIDVDRWEAESDKDPRFVLTVPWKPVGLTVRELIEKELTLQKVWPQHFDAAALANHLLRAAKPVPQPA